jgi:hypothetical protein
MGMAPLVPVPFDPVTTAAPPISAGRAFVSPPSTACEDWRVASFGPSLENFA